MQKAPPTPPNTIVNKNPKWNKLLYPPHINPPPTQAPPLPIYEINTIPKFPPQYSYYTDGSFVPPRKVENGPHGYYPVHAINIDATATLDSNPT